MFLLGLSRRNLPCQGKKDIRVHLFPRASSGVAKTQRVAQAFAAENLRVRMCVRVCARVHMSCTLVCARDRAHVVRYVGVCGDAHVRDSKD
jgi:hypothetical protein